MTKSESNVIIISYNANQAAEIHQLAPDLMISASVKSKADLGRLNQKNVPNNKEAAFVGVSAPATRLYSYLHKKGITCILKTRGNLAPKAKAKPQQKVYVQLVANCTDILSTDELKLAGNQLDQYRKTNKMKFHNLIVK